MTFRIRKTATRDIASLAAIERSADSAFETIPALAWVATDGVQPEDLHHRLCEQGYSAVMVNANDAPVGFINGDYIDGALHILGVAVMRDCQGMGLGKRLMADAICHARAKQLSALTLTTFRNVPWNQPFYARLGFSVISEADMPDALARLLDEEAAHGFARDSRCAMRLSL
ncbi:GNAT family N-acetyltransferase [Cronobacter sakazakii]|uniref:GNAT family N-acetyltransferase n=1 Tax=Cronobacter sakazakii TaxID=28141 RepID=UPI000BE9723A|nr:GNAT family N-acetyltransferase [Cronobacter sakazakii]ELY2651626.1 GNAT family N-acetyltransferase [Cronobacter sakazakii]ELY2688785.1 GNAT family N-acetyltransferase [Cronobacter sakazakii]ELY2730290.1 GNAT family N-acetyltransferase [Cronobacter sakazakii]ELY2811249.1 GNAT family N-acetyltransferase [Cronobacter sakazakii]ELY3458621.1 GNAT family N-acetyltransferase [Cronobacter sakazakii]